MLVNQIALERSGKANPPGEPVFRWTVHHVIGIFLALLPRKFRLDGSTKVQVTCGPRVNEPLKYTQMLGCTEYFVEDFSFARYFAAAPAEREEIALQVLEEAWINMASQYAEDSAAAIKVIKKAADEVRSSRFTLKIPIKKLCKQTPDRKGMVNVYRTLNREVGEEWSAEIVTRDRTRIHVARIGNTPGYLDLTDKYKFSSWEGSTFCLLDRRHRNVYELEAWGDFQAYELFPNRTSGPSRTRLDH